MTMGTIADFRTPGQDAVHWRQGGRDWRTTGSYRTAVCCIDASVPTGGLMPLPDGATQTHVTTMPPPRSGLARGIHFHD